MLDNFWLAKCVHIFGVEDEGTRAECNECKRGFRLTPDVLDWGINESKKAHFFRVIKHTDKCKAYRLYSQDYEESMDRLDDSNYSE